MILSALPDGAISWSSAGGLIEKPGLDLYPSTDSELDTELVDRVDLLSWHGVCVGLIVLDLVSANVLFHVTQKVRLR